jgi:phage shock protein PspC (stress-responsive transcriptional regulator)
MKLTQPQQTAITRYLREVAMHMDDRYPIAVRRRELNEFHRKIQKSLGATANGGSVTNEHLKALLTPLGPAEKRAATLLPRVVSEPVAEKTASQVRTQGQRAPRAVPNRQVKKVQEREAVWLGVCARLSERMDIEVWYIRALAIILGVTGPLAVVLYLGLYAEMYYNAEDKERPTIVRSNVVKRFAMTFGVAFSLFVGTHYGSKLIYFLNASLLRRPQPVLGPWGWIEEKQGTFFLLTLLFLLPLAMLSAMPLANAWDQSLKRILQAGLAVYGLVLSFGIASLVVGIILSVVRDFTH